MGNITGGKGNRQSNFESRPIVIAINIRSGLQHQDVGEFDAWCVSVDIYSD